MTSVESIPLLSGHGQARVHLRSARGLLLEVIYPAGVGSPEHSGLHSVIASTDSRWLEFKTPAPSAWP